MAAQVHILNLLIISVEYTALTCHLSNELDDSSVVVRDQKPAVVCLPETWLHSSVPNITIDLHG